MDNETPPHAQPRSVTFQRYFAILQVFGGIIVICEEIGMFHITIPFGALLPSIPQASLFILGLIYWWISVKKRFFTVLDLLIGYFHLINFYLILRNLILLWAISSGCD